MSMTPLELTQDMDVPKIALKGVTKAFGPKVVLDGVDLDIQRGESVVIIGGSGTGKSVLLKSILGILQPDAGTIRIDGEDTTHITGRDRERAMAKFGDEARAAFAEALTRDGDDLTALYYSARILTTDGRYEEARRLYGVVQSRLAADDGRQQTVAAEIAALDQSAQTAATVQAQIGGMVAGLEARLAKNPEDPDGWARLLRSYRVLKNVEGEKRVLANLDRLYADRPAIARDIVQRADRPVGAQ